MQILSHKEEKASFLARIYARLFAMQAWAFSLFNNSLTAWKAGNRGISTVMGLVLGGVAIIVLVVIVIIVDLFVNTATTVSGLSTAQKGNLTNIVATGNSALNLGAVVPLIIIAIALIGAVLGIFVLGQGRRNM